MSHLLPSAGPPQKLSNEEPRQFDCELEHSGRSAAWLRLHGELDLAYGQEFAESVEQALASALLVMVDLRDLTYIDSVGIHELIKADARARRSGRRLVLVRGRGQVDRIFVLIGLSHWLNIIELKPILLQAQAPPGTTE